MILLSPWWCLLILFALLPWIGPWRGKNLIQNVLRSLMFVCLGLALSQPRLTVNNQQVHRVLIIDRSESVTADAKDAIANQLSSFTHSLDRKTSGHLVVIGQPLTDNSVSQFKSVSQVSPESSQGSSPLSAAIARAQSLIPNKAAGSVSIASDSLATRPDDNRAIAALRSSNIPIHWIELPTTQRPPTPVQVRWPAPLRQGTSGRVIVKVVSNSAAAGEVTLQHASKTLASAPFNNSNPQQFVELTFEPKDAGFLDCEVIVSSGEERQTLPVVLPIERPHQLLYLGDLQKGGSEKLAKMLGPSFEVTTNDVNDPDGLSDLLQKTDLVMLDDLPATSLPKETELQLVSAVQNDGLGIVMSGGRASFGAGGWHSRPIESLLPVELVQKEEKRDPSTSLVIVIDTSGSMSGVRVQLAKEVARLAMRRLLPHDKVGIVEFFGAKRWAAPLQPASNAIELQRALNRMDAGGGTVILPALEEAFYGLQNVDTRYKHVLVLTDGGVEAGDFESLMRRMANEGINVSTVLAGGGYHSEFLVNIANWGKGRFYNVPNRFNLPEILLKQPSTTKLPAYRPGNHAVHARGGTGWWGDVDMSNLPNLTGYVESKPRVGSQVLLETVNEKHPILATWRYGLGRVTTLTTEPLGQGTQPWQEWTEYSQSLSRILQRSAADARDPFQFTVENDGGKVIIHAIRQQSRNTMTTLDKPVAKVNDSNETLNFVARSPDRFVAFLPAPPNGQTMRIQTSSSATPLRQHPLVVTSPTVDEQHVDPQSSIDLGQLADIAGGQRFSLTSDWINAPASMPTGKAFWSPTPWLFGLSLLLFLAEIVWRRLPSPTTTRVAVAATGLFVCLAISQPAIAQQTATSPTHNQQLVDETNTLIDESIKNGVDRKQVDQLFRSATLIDGSVENLLPWLTESRGDMSQPRGQVIAEIECQIAYRRGDLKRAADVLDKLLELKTVRDQRIDLQIRQAKMHDALGDVPKARELYENLAKQELGVQEQRTVRLRLALIGLTDEKNKSTSAKPLIELAQNSKDLAFRNRAAIVLAVQNQPTEAVKLFTITGEGTARFRNASRFTEWAIRAQDREKAITAAWDAVNSAELTRDRNYGLALLVESYRLKENTKGLEQLVKELTLKNDSNEPMADETRLVWISLLRELGRYDDAIKLFKSAAENETGFTIEMRRELLEMEGEAGYEDRMIQSYHKLIQSNPNEMTWRSGLTQILLEKGLDTDARALWTDFINESTNATTLLRSAQTLGEFGMDGLAKVTIERMVQLKANEGQALLYWADLQQRRGSVDVAEQTLGRILAMDTTDDVRAELASAFERIGRHDKAIEVNEAIRASRETVAEDLELRLAWLYSEVGDEEKAEEQWLALWRKVKSIPRRRYIEDRLMTVASRLGTLADIAIELEEKLSDGTADAREAGLLIRIYSRVNDSVAATEISSEYMAKTGRSQVQQLQEKGRIYQICNDYWNYEKVIEELIEVDPAGKTEYLRQLALSMLERGKSQQARDVLMTLRNADDGQDSIGGEFEAGVLSLVGMKSEAAGAYRKGIATHPDRIESYLLLANLLNDMGETDRAIGMFQFLAENAERDDLFTIAIDGMLNMQAGKNRMQWARCITLERLAGREDKNYLYQLLSDLSAEVNNKPGQILALENSLAVSGTRRLSVLRECMELSSRIRGGAYSNRSSRGPSNNGNKPFFAFGRRLIGLGELLPPQVFLDLGQAFLSDGNTAGAERTFAMARNLADPRTYQREVAMIFEGAGKIPEALERYEKLLRTRPSDVALIARVAKLNEREGKTDTALRFYQRGLNLLVAQTPLTSGDKNEQTSRYYARNLDTYEKYIDRFRQGLVITLPNERIDNLVVQQVQLLHENLAELNKARGQGRNAENLSESPRIEKLSNNLRSLFSSLNRIEDLEAMNAELIQQFPNDKLLVTKLATELTSWARYDSVERMLQIPNLKENSRQQLLGMLKQTKPQSNTRKLSPTEMWQQIVPALMDGDNETAKNVLRRVDQRKSAAPGLRPSETATNVETWIHLALAMGDEGLALQFARSNVKNHDPTAFYYGVNTPSIFKNYERILPEEPFGDLVRYSADLYKADSSRVKDYLWIVSNYPDYLRDEVLSDQEILKRIENNNWELSHRFKLHDAIETVPESIRFDVIKLLLAGISKVVQRTDLIEVPCKLKTPLDPKSAAIILKEFEKGIDPAIQQKRLLTLQRLLPKNGTVVGCPDNFELLNSMLDLLSSDKVRKTEPRISNIADCIKAVALHQAGETEAAIELAITIQQSGPITDNYYVKNPRNWVNREITSTALDRFIEVIEKDIKDGKPTVAQTDQRLAFITQSGNKDALRSGYLQAIEDHANQSKYAAAYERFERQNQRPAALIDFYKNQLAKAKNSRTSTKLGESLIAFDHLPKAMPYWTPEDDRKKSWFESQKESRSKTQPTKKDPKNQKVATTDADQTKSYKLTMRGVKQAIDDENFSAAERTIRKIWRKLPSGSDARYRRTQNLSVNGMKWPEDASNSDAGKQVSPDEKTEQNRQAAIARSRKIARGGLATFAPKAEKTAPKKVTNAWEVLAEYPFAVKEMELIMRFRSNPNDASMKDVSRGLLQARRNRDGDEAIFESLIQEIRRGNLGSDVKDGFFTMLEDGQSLDSTDSQLVIEKLLSHLDYTNVNHSAQLAGLCAKTGQFDRATALYRHCILLDSGQNRNYGSRESSSYFSKLLTEAKEFYSSAELMKLAESMFEISGQTFEDTSQLLKLREQHLPPAEAASRTRSLFDALTTATTSKNLRKLVPAVSPLARNGDHEQATECLISILNQPKQPVFRMSPADLIRMFPKDTSNYKDIDKWLVTAATAVAKCQTDATENTDAIVWTLLTIALRQCENDNAKSAAETLSAIDQPWLTESSQHQLLAIDVMRLAGETERALDLAMKIHTQRRLTHLRFGDLLRDKHSVDGEAAAVELFDELIELSMDKDLLAAATEIAGDDQRLLDRIEELQADYDKAEKEYSTRLAAAKEREKTIRQWRTNK